MIATVPTHIPLCLQRLHLDDTAPVSPYATFEGDERQLIHAKMVYHLNTLMLILGAEHDGPTDHFGYQREKIEALNYLHWGMCLLGIIPPDVEATINDPGCPTSVEEYRTIILSYMPTGKVGRALRALYHSIEASTPERGRLYLSSALRLTAEIARRKV